MSPISILRLICATAVLLASNLLLPISASLADESSPAKRLEARQLDSLWKDLASDNAAVSFRALLTLARDTDSAVPFLQTHLQPVVAPDPRRVALLIKDLGSDRYADRTRALRELDGIGELVETDLHKTLTASPTLEVRRRVEQLVKKLDERRDPVTSPKMLQALRAVELLEYIGTAEARAILAKIAGGCAGARPTVEAKETLERSRKLELVRKARGAPEPDTLRPGKTPESGLIMQLGTSGNGQLVDYITFSPDGNHLAIAGEEVQMWSIRTGKLLGQMQPKANPLALTFSPGGKLMLASVGRASGRRTTWFLQTWDPAKVSEPRIRSWESNDYLPSVGAMSADGKILAAGRYGTVTIWYLVFPKELRRLELKRTTIDDLAMSPDGSLLAGSLGYVGTMLSKWITGNVHLVEPEEKHWFSGATTGVIFAPNGKWALARRGMRLQMINLNSNRWGMPIPVQENRWSLPAISPDGRTIAVATGRLENRIELWERATGKKRLTVAGFDARVRSLAFSPDNRNLAAGLNDGTVLIWDVVRLPLHQGKD